MTNSVTLVGASGNWQDETGMGEVDPPLWIFKARFM